MRKVNEDKIKEFLAERYMGSTQGTRNQMWFNLKHVFDNIDKPWDKIDKLTLVDYFNKVYSGDIKSGRGTTTGKYTLEQRKTICKCFFRWCYGIERGDRDPEVIRWIRSNRKSAYAQKSYTDMLTQEEVDLLLQGFYTLKDRCLFSVVFDSGSRIMEILSLKIGDIIIKDGKYNISIRDKICKTKINRVVPLNSSVVVLKQYLAQHPDRSNPNEYLILNRKGKPYKNSICANVTLKRCAKRVGLEKKVHNHLLRHSRFTILAQGGINEETMRKMGGWEPGSPTPSKYMHLCFDDVRNAVDKLEGDLSSTESQVEIGVMKKTNELQKEFDKKLEKMKKELLDEMKIMYTESQKNLKTLKKKKP